MPAIRKVHLYLGTQKHPFRLSKISQVLDYLCTQRTDINVLKNKEKSVLDKKTKIGAQSCYNG